MPLRGALSEISLEDILRLLQATGKTGVLEVRGPRSRGALELTAGQLSAAHCGDDRGPVALGAVLAIGVGDFVFRPGDTGTPNLDGPLDELLVSGRADAQRIAATRALIRDGGARFALSERATVRDAFSVTGEQWRVLLAVDGRRDVSEIARAAAAGPLATLLTLGELVQNGLVDTVEFRAEAAAEPGLSGERPWPGPPSLSETPQRDVPRAPSAESPLPWTVATSSTEVATEVETTPLPAAAVTDARLAALAVTSRIEAPTPESGPPVEVDADALGAVRTEGPEAPAVQATSGRAEAALPAEGASRPAGTPGLRGMLTAVTKAVTRTRGPHAQAGPTSAPTAPASAPTAPTAPTASPSLVVATPADLARVANALIAEYSSGRYGVWPQEGIATRLRRVYELDPVGMPLPLAGEELDVRALDSPHVEAGLALPYLAMLIRQLREDGARAFGGESADRGFRAALVRVRGWDEALASAPEEILARSKAPTHGCLTLMSGGERRTWTLARRDYVIGRASVGCDIRLEDGTVAERHAHLSPYLDGFQLRDLGSPSGTSVDGTPLTPLVGEHFLRGGETIRLGEVSLLYERLPDAEAANKR